MNEITDRIKAIEDKIKGQAKLLAISKRQDDSKIMQAYACGFKSFGENYVQELLRKQNLFPKDIEWHMIGHLQSNKVKQIAPFIKLIHTVDSIKLLKEINKQALKNNRIIPCLLQVRIAKEETKSGLDESSLMQLLDSAIFDLKNVNIRGLMGMSTFTEDQQLIAQEFKELNKLFKKVQKKYPQYDISELSMGMSNDWPIAIENGSTIIRIGSGIFGART